MDEKEYEKFMAHLYNEHVRYRNKRMFHKHFDPEWGHRWNWEWERLVDVSNLLRYINRCANEYDIYRTITRERIAQLPDEIQDGTRINRHMLEESGFMDAIDTYYDEIVEGMKLEHMPPQEFEVMRQLGSNDAETELSAVIHIMKSRHKSMHSYNQEIRIRYGISYQLENLEKKLHQQHQELRELKDDDSKEQPRKSRRWFKGLGQIAQGSALSIANIGLAVGAFPIPVAAETAGWGAIVSSITGVGMVLNGVGEFRGE